ncbi:MAG: Asp-tRNA(Asn)/Glu-tRNA(Gln) amidotransferase subunit GatB, partial [Candidatus Micrarchaeota archaeon]|nr:Asp-tRNA(Asn)/Glu-tRNA(Gln) amidotransferase subunit GatB [Candidatus Micrarchaeota archaeon]
MVKIGLEVHVQLNTKTKLFCACPVREAEPNSLTCPTCLGLPGGRPVPNRTAVEHAVKVCLALNSSVSQNLRFSRKTYFYPDMAKNFQITQFELPIGSGGYLETASGKVRIRRVNLEEDPARLVHVGGLVNSKYVLVDYNRSGIPLCEIVTEPDMESPEAARDFLRTLCEILEYLGVYDPLRCTVKADANVSVGDERVEIKNISGFREIEKALKYEVLRQKNLIRSGRRIERETRAWDPDAGVTRSMRKKETEEDYGYINEPDIPEIDISEIIKTVRSRIPELPEEKRRRYQTELGLGVELARTVTTSLGIAKFFEKTLEYLEPEESASWMVVLKKILNYHSLRIEETKITPDVFSMVVKSVTEGKISDRAGELILREVVFAPEKLESLLKEFSSTEVSDELVDEVVSENRRAVEDYLSGNEKALDFLVGQVM